MSKLQNIIQQETLRLTTSFVSSSNLKSRIMKINQSPSAKSARLRFAGIVPLFLVCVLVASCVREKFPDMNLKENTNKIELPAGYKELNTYEVNSKSLK